MLRMSVSIAMCCLSLAGCVVAPPARVVRPAPADPMTVIAYPQQGQSAAQLDRDRYECHLWAVQQSGTDPRNPPAGAPVYQAPPVDTAATIGTSAVVGGLIGAAVAPPWHAGAGLAVGALTGALVGAVAADSANTAAQATPPPPPPSSGMVTYRRAMDACLEGRGYSVR